MTFNDEQKKIFNVMISIMLFILIIVAIIVYIAYRKRRLLFGAACIAALAQPEFMPALKLSGIC